MIYFAQPALLAVARYPKNKVVKRSAVRHSAHVGPKNRPLEVPRPDRKFVERHRFKVIEQRSEKSLLDCI